MRLNIKTFENIITMKTILIKEICYAFARFEFIIMIKNSLIRDLDI